MDHVRFKKIQHFSTDYAPANVTQYESTLTGMRVVVVDLEGPKITGNFVLATEILDDSGAPHTLEHLCFLGSRTYRYKGFLDKLATRAYANTNAETATDYTKYELDAAGWEAFAQILPVYLEHLILPTLTDAGCYTEVHHVDGSGNDAGVVYSEMQGFESDVENLMHWKYKRMLYPEGIGFRYETGGRLDQLRTLTADRIRQFHREMYQPRNLCLVLTGSIDHANLLDILHEYEGTILKDVPKLDSPFKRPWVDSKPAQPLVISSTETLEFPEEDESSGEVSIHFFGPEYQDSLLCTAMYTLLVYLTGSSASVLVNSLVEKDQLANSVAFNVEQRPRTVMQFFFSGVATDKLETIKTRFFEILRNAADNSLDLNYLKDCVSREKRKSKFDAEDSPEYFSDTIVKDFLYGRRDGSTLQSDLENLKVFDILESWDESQWRYWLKLWLLEAPHAAIIARPSSALSKQFKATEKSRVSQRRKDLGKDGLKQLADRLASAQAENDQDVPVALLQQFQVPTVDSIHFINTTTARAGPAKEAGVLGNPIQRVIDDDGDSPLFIHFEHIKSNFAYLTLVLGTESVPQSLRPLLSLYIENFFSTPIQRDGHTLKFEKVITELEKDTVGYEIDFGQRIGNPEVLIVKLYVEVEKYQNAIQWLKDLLEHSIRDVDRLKATTAKMLAGIPSEKRDGDEMVKEINMMVGSAPSSINRACGTLTRAVYLKHVTRLLESDPQIIQDQLKEVNVALCQATNFRVLVIADIRRLQHPVKSWSILIEGHNMDRALLPLGNRRSRLSDQGEQPGNNAFVVPLPSVESSCALAVTKGPFSHRDRKVPALMLAIAYLNAVEGPIWNAVRGTGLAYSSAIFQNISSGHIYLSIYMSPDASKAFVAVKEVVGHLAKGKTEFDTLAMEGAISSIVLGFANADATMASAAESSFVRQVMQDLPKDWPAIILEKIRKLQVAEVKEAIETVILPLFEAETANLFVTCATVMEKRIVKGFEAIGFQPKVKPLASFQDNYGVDLGINADDDEADDDEDMGSGTDDDMEEDDDESDTDEEDGDDGDEGQEV